MGWSAEPWLPPSIDAHDPIAIRMSDSFAQLREQMVERQLVARGIGDARVLAAMRSVPRHLFVDPSQLEYAYHDSALRIDCEQTISQPYIVALMTQSLELHGGERVLEIGTGSGYQAAVLAEMGVDVFSIERHATLAENARERLNQLGYSGVQIRVGDGCLGWPEAAPFDRIIITATSNHVPLALWEQLIEGGTLVAPLGPPHAQVLQQLRKQAGQALSTRLADCRFVPLVGSDRVNSRSNSD